MRLVYFALGFLNLGLGIIGIFVPLMPTTIFILMAAYFFSKSSERWHRWLLNHPVFGRMVTEWQAHGVIRPRAKALATTMITLMLGYPVLFSSKGAVFKAVLALTGVLVVSYILSRPSRPRADAVPVTL